jgi:hypothetical protein
MPAALEFNGFVEDSAGIRRSFQLRISQSHKTDENDYFCTVQAPLLLDSEKRIFGIDEEQAHQLAVRFVMSLIGNGRVLDLNGNPTQLG